MSSEGCRALAALSRLGRFGFYGGVGFRGLGSMIFETQGVGILGCTGSDISSPLKAPSQVARNEPSLKMLL